MKTTINQLIVPIFFLALVSIGCKKSFLDITPKGKLIAQKTSDYALLLNNTPELGNQFFQYNVEMGDEMAAFGPYYIGLTQKQQRAFQWADNIFESADDAPEISYPVKALYYYNIIINEVMNSEGGTDDQKKGLRAEALAGRAWTYLQLINFYGKPYVAATAASDAGFPIITEANVNLTDLKRASVKEVYDFIVNDLTTAIPDLSATPVHRFRMSRPAATAILGKTYLFMGKYAEALQQLNASLSDVASSTYPIRLYDYNVDLAPTGQFAPDPVFGPFFPNYLNFQESLYSRQATSDATQLSNALLISPQTAALYGSTDMRLKLFSNIPYPSGTPFPLGMMQRLAPFSPIIGMTLPDVYLMRAEVKARLNDLAGAKADVEALRSKRMPATDATVPAPIAADRIALVKFILEERIREFSATGYRWFDMRRISVDPEFSSTLNTVHTVYSATGAVQTTYTLKPERLTFKIPPKVLSQNPGMVDNP